MGLFVCQLLGYLTKRDETCVAWSRRRRDESSLRMLINDLAPFLGKRPLTSNVAFHEAERKREREREREKQLRALHTYTRAYSYVVAFESENDRERRLWQNVTRFAKDERGNE